MEKIAILCNDVHVDDEDFEECAELVIQVGVNIIREFLDGYNRRKTIFLSLSLSLENSGIDEFKTLETDLVDIAGAVVVLKNILDSVVIDRTASLKTMINSYASEVKQ